MSEANFLVDEPGAPHLRTPQEAYLLLNRALEHLISVEHPKLDALIQKLEAHREHLFSFLDQLHQQIHAIPLEGIDDPQYARSIRALVVQELLLSRQRARTQNPKVVDAYAKVWSEIAHLGPLQPHYALWRKTLALCLYRPRRTSSPVETINSPLRTFQQIHRNPSQPLLDLYAIHHDLTPLGPGSKRQGNSPYQRLGVDLGSDDWLEVLRTYRNRQLSTTRSLKP